MDALQPWHLIVVAIVGIFLFFAWKQLPDMSRSLGRSLRIFKSEIKSVEDTRQKVAATATDLRHQVGGELNEVGQHLSTLTAPDATAQPATNHNPAA
jgi:sec-independent protein translocase protein TatA